MAAEKLHPIWIHAGVLLFLVCGVGELGLKLLSPMYVAGVVVYYVGRWTFRVLSFGSGHPWFYVARRLALSGPLALILGIGTAFLYIMSSYPPASDRSSEAIRIRDSATFFWVIYSYYLAIAYIPISFCILYFFSIPLRIFQWRANVAQKKREQQELIESRRLTEQRRMESQREQRLQTDEVSQRSEVRAQCELLYELYAPEISSRFPRTRFEAFMQKYMSDSQSVKMVQIRGKELQELIQQHRRAVVPDEKPQTIAELSQWYLREKQNLEQLPLDEELKQEHLVALDIRYSELTQELMQNIKP